MDSTEQIQQIVSNLKLMVQGGSTPTDACKRIKALGISAELVAKAQIEYEQATGRIRKISPPRSLIDPDIDRWYVGPSEGDRFWPALKKYLVQKNWDAEDLRALDDASSKVVSCMQPAGKGRIDTRGLVVGYVQSGKTANFTAVISKCADVGYKFFIVLSGIHNKLRKQTQQRLESELVTLNRESWHALTTLEDDFRPHSKVNAMLTDLTDQKVLCVVKKNATVLRKLRDWLKVGKESVLGNCPVLIIDDEADQASIDTSRSDKRRSDKRTSVNDAILEILKLLPRVAYIGYTATPFANVLIDPSVPEDLYPRDFIIDLPMPKEYFGSERLFGRDSLPTDDADESIEGLDMIRKVWQREVTFLQPEKGAKASITPTLKKALRYFVMASAARRARKDVSHSTMLVHTSVRTDVHKSLFKPVKDYIEEMKTGLADPRFLEKLRAEWERECSIVRAQDLGERATTFSELKRYLVEVLNEIEPVVENSKSLNRLEQEELVPGQQGKVTVVIGGNILSRGLTLAGLVVSYFVRTSSAYDTLLQMARWFGYRKSYSDLPRIWMTNELRKNFHDLATVEHEIRLDIQRYELEQITPLDATVRIRMHPSMIITSNLKMQKAITVHYSYSDYSLKTIKFKHRDKDWLDKNIAAVSQFLKSIYELGIHQSVEDSWSKYVDVPVDLVKQLFSSYEVLAEHENFNSAMVRDYIKAQEEVGGLSRWNVVIVNGGKNAKTLKLYDTEFRLNQRSRLYTADLEAKGMASLGAITAPKDIEVARALSEAQNQPYLLIYPIDKDSKPRFDHRNPRRRDLNAAQHIVGLVVRFPRAKKETPRAYKTADLSKLITEEYDVPEEPESEDELLEATV